MARAHMGERRPITLRVPIELLDELDAEAVKFDVDRHAFILAMIIRGVKNWKAS